MRICYAWNPYVSHARAAAGYRRCLEREGFVLTPEPAEADLWIWHAEPWAIPGYVRAFRAHPKRPTVAVSVWETDRLPASYPPFLAHVDRIWTPSHYSAAVFEQAARPVDVIPHVIDAPVVDPQDLAAMRQRIGWHDGDFYFYCIGALGNRRKGVAESIAAFAGLFGERETATIKMVVKTTQPLPAELADVPGIVPIHGWVTDGEIAALHATCDCLVSLHHSEGFGLHLAEAMAVGNLVIATAHGGNLDFMSHENSLLVPCRVEHLRGDDLAFVPRLTPEMQWGYVDMDAARSALECAARERDRFAPIRARAADDMRRFASTALSGRVAALAKLAAGES